LTVGARAPILAPMPAADLRADTTAIASGADYRLDVGRAWDFRLPSGGVIMTAALRAAAAAIADPAMRLLSATAIFCEPIHPGPVVITPTVLRRGASAIQTRTWLRAEGSSGCEVIATFARDRSGPDVVARRAPDVPPPEACADLLAGGAPMTRARFFDNLECRLARGVAPWVEGYAAGPARALRWFRYQHPQREAGTLDRLALPPIADTMPGALTHAIGPSDYRFYAPSVDLTLHVVDDTDREWILIDAFLGRAVNGWATGRAEIWDDRGKYLGAATQTMYLRTVTGDPPIVDASGHDR